MGRRRLLVVARLVTALIALAAGSAASGIASTTGPLIRGPGDVAPGARSASNVGGVGGAGINAVVLQPDGKLVAAGAVFTPSAPPHRGTSLFALARYKADGSLDPSFGSDGRVTTAIGTSDGAGALALQPDGKLVAAGGSVVGGREEFALARYNGDGSLDTTFGSGGTVATAIDGSYAAAVDAIGVQPDGKIVVAGDGYTDSTEEFVVARYNADGSLDTSFGSGGRVTTVIGPEVVASALVLQPDGKVVVAGGSIYGGGGGFALARYNANGSLDPSFGSGGTETVAIGPAEDSVRALALQPDGKIVAVGYSVDSEGGNPFAVARFNVNGALDTTFGNGGAVTTPLGDNGAFALALQPDGKIVAGGIGTVGAEGAWQDGFGLVRYNPNGSPDTSFGNGGKVTTAISSAAAAVFALAVQPDGKLVGAGAGFVNSTEEFTLARYNADGSLDTTFGSGGVVMTSFPRREPAPGAISVSMDGAGSGTVTSLPEGINCGTTCGHQYAPGTSVTLTATPAAWSTFTGWSGGGCRGTGTCSVTAGNPVVVTATFSVIPHCVVPKVKGKTLAAAKRSIKSRNCAVGEIQHGASTTVKKGHVIAQKPRAGARVIAGAKVNLVVSKGGR